MLKEANALFPVESVSWLACERTLSQLGLELPTEAQWQYAARAGTTTPWWTGADRESLRDAANIADQAAVREQASFARAARDWPGFDDGFPFMAPIGSLRPNPFGLHDIHGNVMEWCAERLGLYGPGVEEGSGRRIREDARSRVLRGGSYTGSAAQTRCSQRNTLMEDGFSVNIGLRPARRLAR